MLMSHEDEAECRPYSQKPQRTWKRSSAPSRSHEWYAPAVKTWGERSRFSRVVVIRQETNPFSGIEKAIDESAALLQLPAGWDDEGAIPIAQATWENAVTLLRGLAHALHQKTGEVLPVPAIGPCADGSIELFWKTSSFKLLVNMKPTASDSDFYGKSSDGVEVKGPIEPTSTQILNLIQLLVG